MRVKNCLFLVVFLVGMLFCVTPVLADCEECDINHCDSCGCVLNSSKTACTYANFEENTTSCGDEKGGIQNIPTVIPKTTRIVYLLFQVLVPILLVVFGMIDLVKSISAQKAEDIKKGQQTLIKKIITAVLIFFVFSLVKFIVSAASDNSSNVISCLECFIKDDCK